MDDEKLISLVEKRTYIFNKQHKLFKDINKKRNAWEEISVEMDAPADTCMKRWNVLRERFSRQLKLYVPSGSGAGQKATWHLFDAMMFLKPFVQARRTRGTHNVLPHYSQMMKKQSDDFDMSEFLSASSPPASQGEFNFSFNRPDLSDETSNSQLEKSLEEAVTTFKATCEKEVNAKTNMNESSGSISISDQESSSTPSSSRKRKATTCSLENTLAEAAKCFSKVCEAQLSSTNSSLQIFGSMVVANLTELSPAKQDEAIQEITAYLISLKRSAE